MSIKELLSYENEFFIVKELYDGIFATFTKPDAVVGGNSLIIDLGDKTFIFDTFMTLSPAKVLFETAKKLTGHNNFIIGNSHFHYDHVRGNQVFPDNSIIFSSIKTREIMPIRSISELEKNKQNWPEQLTKEREKLSHENDPKKKDSIILDISLYEQLLKELPDITIRLPDISFDSKVIYHGKKRNVELITFGGAHTPGDVILYLPIEKIVHAADVVLNKNHFFMEDGLPLNWKNVLEKISRLDFDILVPGHGDVGDRQILETAVQYLSTLETLAKEAIKKNYSDDQIANIKTPEPFDSWSGEEDSFTRNIKIMIKALKKYFIFKK